MSTSDTYTLGNGVEIPQLGLGTWFIDDGDVAGAVRAAVPSREGAGDRPLELP